MSEADNNRPTTGAPISEDVSPAAPARDRDQRGKFVVGNRLAAKHGVSSYRANGPGALTPELRQAMREFRDELIVDAGGPEGLTAVRRAHVDRLVELEAILALLRLDLERSGLRTARGHARASFRQYLATLDRWSKIAAAVGMERRARQARTIGEAFLDSPELSE